MTSRFHNFDNGRTTVRPPHESSGPPRRWAVWLATGLGVGYGPVMPGTYGSILGVGCYLLLVHLVRALPHPKMLLCLAAALITALSFPIVAVALRSFSVHDPQQVVLDEIVGQVVTLLALPVFPRKPSSYWFAVLAAFILFRALDAAKPYPIWQLERLRGAWGVVADDVGAGIVGALLLMAAIWLRWIT